MADIGAVRVEVGESHIRSLVEVVDAMAGLIGRLQDQVSNLEQRVYALEGEPD